MIPERDRFCGLFSSGTDGTQLTDRLRNPAEEFRTSLSALVVPWKDGRDGLLFDTGQWVEDKAGSLDYTLLGRILYKSTTATATMQQRPINM
jgi:hypothetical protein